MHKSWQNRGMITVYGIPNCDSVKKARAWLTEHVQPHAFHDFKKLGVAGNPNLGVDWRRCTDGPGRAITKDLDTGKADANNYRCSRCDR